MTEELHNLNTAKTIHLFNVKQQLVETLGTEGAASDAKLSQKSFLFRTNRNLLLKIGVSFTATVQKTQLTGELGQFFTNNNKELSLLGAGLS